MLSPTTPFKKLPASLDPIRAVFYDGIRHAAEIAELAYRRLQLTLTAIANGTESQEEELAHYTAAFLDAWAFVDVADRLRALRQQLPGPVAVAQTLEGARTWNAALDPVRQVRNVSDHLATRAQYVAAKKSAALGVLSWLSMKTPTIGTACVIRPGIVGSKVRVETGHLLATGEVEVPSGRIHLQAGEHRADLSAAYGQMAAFVATLEQKLAESFATLPLDAAKSHGADVLVTVRIDTTAADGK